MPPKTTDSKETQYQIQITDLLHLKFGINDLISYSVLTSQRISEFGGRVRGGELSRQGWVWLYGGGPRGRGR